MRNFDDCVRFVTCFLLYRIGSFEAVKSRLHCFHPVGFAPPVGCDVFATYNKEVRGPGSVVVIATAYGLDGPGIESRWWRDFPHLPRSALRPTQPPVQWVPGLSRGLRWPGRDADPSPPYSAAVKNRVELYLYSP
jgi:hypothetical protein